MASLNQRLDDFAAELEAKSDDLKSMARKLEKLAVEIKELEKRQQA